MFASLLITTMITMTISRPHLNPKGPTHVNYAVDCLQKLAEGQFRYLNAKGLSQNASDVQLFTVMTTENMSSPGFEVQRNLMKELYSSLKFSIEVIDDGRNDFGVEMVMEFCLMVVDSVEAFDEKLEVLTRLQSFSSEALYLVYYSNLEKDHETVAATILEKFWRKFINDVIVLIPRNLEEFVLFSLSFSTKPDHHCLDSSGLQVLDVCIKGRIRRRKNYFEDKNPKNFGNCTLDVIANQIDPFVIDEDSGFEIFFIKELGRSLNISFNITLSGEDSWGVKQENDTWTNGLGRVQQEACIGIGNFYVVPDYDVYFDYTTPHFETKLVWVVPIAQYVPRWRVLTVIFTWYLWLLCIGVVIACAVIFKLTSNPEKVKSYKHLDYDFLASFQILITQPAPKQPKSDWTRTCFVSLAIFSIVISSLYTTRLIQVLTQPQREPQVDSLEGVFARDWDIGGLPVDKDIFFVPEDEESMRIYDVFQVNDSLNVWLTSVAEDRDTCIVGSEFFLKYMLAKEDPVVTDGKGKPKIYMLREKIFSYTLSMVTMRGFPFLERINYGIGQMNTFGLVQAMSRRYTYMLEKVDEMQEEEQDVEELSLDHLQGAFIVLMMGYCSGFGVLFVEIVAAFARKKAKQKAKVRKIKRK